MNFELTEAKRLLKLNEHAIKSFQAELGKIKDNPKAKELLLRKAAYINDLADFHNYIERSLDFIYSVNYAAQQSESFTLYNAHLEDKLNLTQQENRRLAKINKKMRKYIAELGGDVSLIIYM